MSILRTAKNLVLKAANAGGISAGVARSRWRQQRLLVLCYHGVSQDDEHEWSDLYISPQRLEQRLNLLRKIGAPVLPFDEAVQELRAGTLPHNAVSLTFDDGARDFHSQAVPVLTAADAHSTLYLCTYYCRKAMPVFDTIVSYMLWKARGTRVTLPGTQQTLDIPRTTGDEAFRAVHRSLLACARSAGMDADAKNAFAREIAVACKVDFDDLNERRILHLMNPTEVRSLDRRLVDVQLHTHRHLTPASPEQTHDELSRNALEIDDLTGYAQPRTHFCYPSGLYSQELVKWLGNERLQTATTCVPGLASKAHNFLEMPRFIDTMHVSDDMFRAWVSGTAEFTQMLRRVVG